MSRMIDAEFLEQEISKWINCPSYGEYYCGYDNALTAVLDLIADAPTLTQPNEPLTLEQLREMDVEPIYVTTKNYGDGWCILNWHGVDRSYTYFSRTGTSEGMSATPLSAKTYGDLWIAYRRPQEGEEEAI